MGADNAKFKKDFAIVRSLVNEFDLLGVVKHGGPPDEYDAMTYALLSGIYNKEAPTEIKAKLLKLMDEYYGGDIATIRPEALNEFHEDIDRTIEQAFAQVQS